MGRIKASIPTGSFYLKGELNKKGEKHLYLRYFVMGKYVMKGTNIWVQLCEWDDKKQKIKTNKNNHVRLNGKLEKIKIHIDNQLHEYDGGVITPKVVKDMLDGNYLPEFDKSKKVGVVDYCNYVNDLKFDRDDYTFSVYYNNQLNIRKFAKFIQLKYDKQITLSNINRSIVDEYVTYLIKEKEVKAVTINKYLNCIIQAVNYAKENGQITLSIAQSIVDNVRPSNKKTTYSPDVDDEGEVKYLSEKQLQYFIDYVPKSNRASRTYEIKDVFLFSFYTCGLRISDIVTLEWKNIDYVKRVINKTQVKTKRKGKLAPRLSSQAIEILKKWEESKKNNRFVFDFLPANFVFGKDHEKELKMKINSATRVINQSLNHIGKEIGLPFSLSIHVARHTFCVMALSCSMSLHIVSQLMGHATIQATEKTYAKYLEKTVNEELSKLDKIYK